MQPLVSSSSIQQTRHIDIEKKSNLQVNWLLSNMPLNIPKEITNGFDKYSLFNWTLYFYLTLISIRFLTIIIVIH